MRQPGLTPSLVCLLLGAALGARAQDVPGAPPDGGVVAPVDAAASPLPDLAPPGRETVVRARREPPESAARRDPSALTTVLPVARFGVAARDIAEVLTRAPSVGVQDAGGWGQARSLVVRGAASNAVPVFLDGIPLSGAGGMVDLSRVPLALAERLEVVRGGAGTRYGGGGLGGAVNIVTRRPDAGGSLLSGELALGPWGTQSGWAGATAPLGERGGALLLVHAGRSRGDFGFLFDASPATPGNALEPRARENNDARAGGVLLRATQRVGGADVDALAEGSALERGLAGPVFNPTDTGRERDGRLALQLRARTGSLRTGELHARAFLRLQRGRVTGLTLEPPPAQVQRLGGAEVEGRWRAGRAHLLSVLAGASGEDVSGVDTRLAQGGRPRWARLALMASDEVSLRDGGVVVAPSLRVERAGPYTLLSPKLGLTARLPARLVLRANAGQAHRAPTFVELYVSQGTQLPNPALRPERALFADVGLTHVLPGELGEVTVGAFGALYEDLITYELYPPLRARPTNFSAARVLGLELEGAVHPTPWLVLAGSWALQATRNLRDDPRFYGRALPYRPAHRGSARVVAGPAWLAARAELSVQGAQSVNRTEETWLPRRALLDVGLQSRVRPGARVPELSLSLELRNATDVRAQDFDWYPLPGRGLFLTVGTALSTSRRPAPPDAAAPDERLDTP